MKAVHPRYNNFLTIGISSNPSQQQLCRAGYGEVVFGHSCVKVTKSWGDNMGLLGSSWKTETNVWTKSGIQTGKGDSS